MSKEESTILQKARESRVRVSYSLPASLIKQIEKYAQEKGVKNSIAAEVLITVGFKALNMGGEK